MSAERHGILLVVEREVREALRRKAVWITAAIALAATTAIVVLPTVLGSSEDRYDVAVVGEVGETFAQTLNAAEQTNEVQVDVEDSADVDTARQAVRDGDVDAALVIDDGNLIVAEDPDSSVVATLRQAVATQRTIEQLGDEGLDDEQIQRVLAAPEVAVDIIDDDRTGRLAAAAVISIAVYLLLFFVTMQVANGVAIEKSNRVSEVLLAIVTPRTLLYGKVIGVGLMALLPLVAGAIPVIVRLVTSDSLPPSTGTAVGAAAAWFVLGAGFYLLAAAALGAMVERQEDAGSAVAGLSILLVASYLVGQSAPDTPIGAVLAYLPFSAPMVEPARLALGVSSPIEVVGSLVICALSVVVMARLATTVYRRAVVRTGSRLHLSDVLRSPA